MKKATVIFRDIMARYAPNHGIAICVKEKPEEEIPDFTNRVTDGWTIPTSAPFRRRCWMPVLCSKDRWSIPAREWGVIAFVRSEPTVLVPTAWGRYSGELLPHWLTVCLHTGTRERFRASASVHPGRCLCRSQIPYRHDSPA